MNSYFLLESLLFFFFFFFFSSRRRHTRLQGDWSSDVCSSDLGTPLGAPPPPAPIPEGTLGIDTAQIGAILGYHGKVNGGVYQVGVPPAEVVTADGIVVPPSMGLATAINFQPTGGSNAAITGDFVLLATEVNPVIRALRSNGIAITALHSHMLTETPRLYFMHYWANDDALKLARGLRAALDKMNVKKPIGTGRIP